MKTLSKLLIPMIAGSLVLSGCKDDPKYENFANFIKEKGKKEVGGFNLHFSTNNKNYDCYYNQSSFNENLLIINIYDGKAIEHFQDANLNGLNFYAFLFDGRDLIKDHSWQTKENKEKYNSLIDSIPKWYEKSKKEARKLSPLEKFNQDNKKIYGAFSKFLKNNPNKKKHLKIAGLYSLGEKIDFIEEKGKINYLEIKIGKTTFSDDELNGLDYITKEKGSGIIEAIRVKDLPQGKQLQFAQEYTKNLTKIMHKPKEKENYKNKPKEKTKKEESKEEIKEETKKKPITEEVTKEKIEEPKKEEIKEEQINEITKNAILSSVVTADSAFNSHSKRIEKTENGFEQYNEKGQLIKQEVKDNFLTIISEFEYNDKGKKEKYTCLRDKNADGKADYTEIILIEYDNEGKKVKERRLIDENGDGLIDKIKKY